MKSKFTIDWLKAALIRALRTIAQTALGMFTIGLALNQINWNFVISVSLVAGIYSILTSIATTLPEAVAADGTLLIDTSNPNKDTYLLNLDKEPGDLTEQKKITLIVDPNAKLSQEPTNY